MFEVPLLGEIPWCFSGIPAKDATQNIKFKNLAGIPGRTALSTLFCLFTILCSGGFAFANGIKTGWQASVQPVATTAISKPVYYAIGLDRMIATYTGPTCRINGKEIGVNANGTLDEAAATAALAGLPLAGAPVEVAVQRPGTATPLWMTTPSGQSLPTFAKDAAGNWCLRFVGGQALVVPVNGIPFSTGGGKSFTGLTVNGERKEAANAVDYAWSYRSSTDANQIDVQQGAAAGSASFVWNNGGTSAYTDRTPLPREGHNILTLNCNSTGAFGVYRNGVKINSQQHAPASGVLDEAAGNISIGINSAKSPAVNTSQDFLFYGLIVTDLLTVPETRTMQWRFSRQAAWRRARTLTNLVLPNEVLDFGKTVQIKGQTAIPGLLGKTNLILNTQEVDFKGKKHLPALAPAQMSEYGISGLYTGDYLNLANSFQADNDFFSDKWEWTVWAIVMFDPAMGRNSTLLDILGMRTGAVTDMNASGKYGVEAPWTVGRHHNNWTLYTKPTVAIDVPQEIKFEMDFTKWPCKVAQAPSLTYLNHDQWGAAHVFAYRDRLHLQWVTQPGGPNGIPPAMSVGDSNDHQPARVLYGVPYVVIIKHRPNPKLDRSNSATWTVYKQGSYVQLKAAPLTEVMAWDRMDCAVATRPDKGALAAPVAGARLMSFGRFHLKYAFQGYRFAAGFIADHITTDDEDLAIFYNGMDLANYTDKVLAGSKTNEGVKVNGGRKPGN
ncbi:MAG: hypothetical protein WC789_08975 [Lentisphaeria bacterium]